jgi:hypothetical protein
LGFIGFHFGFYWLSFWLLLVCFHWFALVFKSKRIRQINLKLFFVVCSFLCITLFVLVLCVGTKRFGQKIALESSSLRAKKGFCF